MAGEEMGDRLACGLTLKPGPERHPLACPPGLHPLAPAPHPSLLSREYPSSRSRRCHLGLTCAYSPSRHRRYPPPVLPPPAPPLRSRPSSPASSASPSLPPPPTHPPPCSPPCPSVPAVPGRTDPADSMQTKPSRRLPGRGNSWCAEAAASLGPGRCPQPGKAQVFLRTCKECEQRCSLTEGPVLRLVESSFPAGEHCSRGLLL